MSHLSFTLPDMSKRKPSRKGHVVASRVDSGLLRRLKREALRVDRDVSWVIRAACEAYLSRDKAAS